jgi:prepilin peptidase CpaA
MDEFRAFFELLGMLFTDPRTGVLLALLAAAAICDYRTYRIPNLLTGAGTVFGLVYNTAVPPSMHADWTWPLAGMLLGFAALLPMYAIRAMGAGDVKLMAMVGVFLGPEHTPYAAAAACVAGGVAALGFGLARRALGRMLLNVKNTAGAMAWLAIGGVRPDAGVAVGESVGKLPFGVSIAVGTIAYVTARQFGFV